MQDKTPPQPVDVRVTELRPTLPSDPMLVLVDGLVGSVQFTMAEHGVLFLVSRLGDEDRWTVDACYVNSQPQWSNGLGARFLRTRHVTDLVIVAELDAAATALMSEEVAV